MDANNLAELIDELIERYEYGNRKHSYIGGREKLSIILNYNTFKKIRQDIYYQTSFLIPNAKHEVFMCAGVIVSWSPFVEEDEYIFGRTDLL